MAKFILNIIFFLVLTTNAYSELKIKSIAPERSVMKLNSEQYELHEFLGNLIQRLSVEIQLYDIQRKIEWQDESGQFVDKDLILDRLYKYYQVLKNDIIEENIGDKYEIHQQIIIFTTLNNIYIVDIRKSLELEKIIKSGVDNNPNILAIKKIESAIGCNKTEEILMSDENISRCSLRKQCHNLKCGIGCKKFASNYDIVDIYRFHSAICH